MKKLSKFSHNPDWKKHASNYVAKRYIKEEPRETYFEDTKLQMEAKLCGEEYNKMNPPKKVDFIQTYVIEMINREGSPLYSVEHLIDGKYIKYNSNSGYVSELKRLTPQAFSHFTFEFSEHSSIVVDVQGVGDLYTDPQIHTVSQEEYGEANLGTKGMALFFSSHICSPLCEYLGLSTFDLSQTELERLQSNVWIGDESTKTVVSPTSPTPAAELKVETVKEAFRRMSVMLDFSKMQSTTPPPPFTPLTPLVEDEFLFQHSENSSEYETSSIDTDSSTKVSTGRERKLTAAAIHLSPQNLSKLEGGAEERETILKILGKVHYDMAVYNMTGRFSEDKQTSDPSSALFHLERAGDCLCSDALEVLYKLYQQIPCDGFEGITVEDTPQNQAAGFGYLRKLAEAGNKDAMIKTAQCFETGLGFGEVVDDSQTPQRKQSWAEAVEWYQKALEAETESEHPNYLLMAKMAEMYSKGGYGLEKDPSTAGDYYTQAADEAMGSMKGKLANKYYMLAEEAWAEC